MNDDESRDQNFRLEGFFSGMKMKRVTKSAHRDRLRTNQRVTSQVKEREKNGRWLVQNGKRQENRREERGGKGAYTKIKKNGSENARVKSER